MSLKPISFSPSKFIAAVVLGLLATALVGCQYRSVEGADFDEELVLKDDGVVCKIGESRPYTGKAYMSFSRDSLPFVHWTGEFKDGRRHGTFVFPASRKADDVFAPGDEHVVRVQFRGGIEVNNEN